MSMLRNNMAFRQDPRIIIVMICAVALAYWLIVPRGGRNIKIESKSYDHKRKEKDKENSDHAKSGHSDHEGMGLGHIDHMHDGSVVKESESQLFKQQEEISRLTKRLETANALMEKLKDEIAAKEALLQEQAKLQEKKDAENDAKIDAIKTDEKDAKSAKQPFAGHRLFHLDLKGAAPKFDYLKKLLPYLQDKGISGVLIEYEDMFPFEDDLSILKCKNAYTKEQVQELLAVAKELDLIVIPLIQTFGHLEFALKHEKYAKLRETEKVTNSICPLKNESRVFVKEMIRQILDLHSEAKWIHLGGDEVWNLKSCAKCKESSMSASALYQHHMIPLFKFVQELKGKEITPIIWDDMMRKWDVKSLKIMAQFVEPMVWAYVPDLDNYYKFPEDMWKRYIKAFPKIWIASSFKGADKPVSNYPPISRHIMNHLSWLKIISSFPESFKVIGIALTGWSRFDHYASLCEVLPASIPSVVFCLTTLRKGYFNDEIQKTVSDQLGFKTTLPVSVTNFKILKIEQGTFPGSDVFELVSKFEKAKGWFESGKVREVGWAGKHHVDNNHISVLQLETIVKSADVCIEMLANMEADTKKILSKYLCQETVTEWIEDKIKRLENDAREMKKRVMKILKIGGGND